MGDENERARHRPEQTRVSFLGLPGGTALDVNAFAELDAVHRNAIEQFFRMCSVAAVAVGSRRVDGVAVFGERLSAEVPHAGGGAGD